MSDYDALLKAGAVPVLEERIKRDLAFARWLDKMDRKDPLVAELLRTLTLHRIAARNLLEKLCPEWQ